MWDESKSMYAQPADADYSEVMARGKRGEDGVRWAKGRKWEYR